jgi:general secretion pathway protein J
VSRRKSHGFTLIEVVVALAILSLCTAVLYQGLEVAIGGWRTAVRRSVDQDSVTTAQRFLRNRIEAISPFRPGASGGPAAVAGTDQELEFTGGAPSAMGPGELRYDLRLRRTRTGSELLVRWRRTWDGRVDQVAGDEWHEDTILQDVRSLEFQYLTVDPVSGASWRPEWDNRGAIPALIRVFVTFEPSDPRRWSHFTIQPLIDADPQCDFDPVSRACRDL